MMELRWLRARTAEVTSRICATTRALFTASRLRATDDAGDRYPGRTLGERKSAKTARLHANAHRMEDDGKPRERESGSKAQVDERKSYVYISDAINKCILVDMAAATSTDAERGPVASNTFFRECRVLFLPS